ncbi:hypothetical protein [Hymenobacter sp. B81]|uniref:hypothetical protein n=1 Tax=Hymenobacter sp. B81 TaxID=3344878 RepID=UPI0037DC3333
MQRRTINVYTSDCASATVESVAAQLFFGMAPNIQLKPLSELQQGPKGRQQMLADRGHLQNCLDEVLYQIRVAEHNPYRYAESLKMLRRERDEYQVRINAITRQLGEEGGVEL